MPFSHHSHSGQFCHHAHDSLEDVVQAAVAKKISVLALTEHMPRGEGELYPEEIRDNITPTALSTTFAHYHAEARHLQRKYASQIHLLVGVELDWIHPVSSLRFIEGLKREYEFDLVVGGVHHVHGIPTDYDREMYVRARGVSNADARVRAREKKEKKEVQDVEGVGKGGVRGDDDEDDDGKQNDTVPAAATDDDDDGDTITDTDEHIYADYLDAQHALLLALQPDIVAHFDVIRLFSDSPAGSFKRWPGVWERVVRNLRVVRGYGGVVEVNSAGVRKGGLEPYPGEEICREFLAMNGDFTLSDDSHGVAQVATHYDQTIAFLERVGIDSLVYFERCAPTDAGAAVRAEKEERVEVVKRSVRLEDIKKRHPFFGFGGGWKGDVDDEG